MIENNARRLKASRVVPFQPLPLDFAKLIAERRADRVGAHVRREATNRHADDIKQRVDAENLRNERERIGKLLQVGAVPAHLLAPIIAQAMGQAESESDSSWDSDIGEDLGARTTVLRRNHADRQYQTSTRTRDREILGFSGLEDFTAMDETMMKRGAPLTNTAALLAVNTKIRARNAGYTRLQILKRGKAEAKAAAAAKAPALAKAKVPAKAPPKAPPKAPSKAAAP